MQTERPTERQVLDWLLALVPLVAANLSINEARERIKAYVPELVERYDSRDFNQASREFVARGCNFFPSYGKLCELLDKWPKPSAQPALPAPEATDLDAMDRSWIAFWHKRRAELYAQQSGFKWGSRDGDLANLASLIQSQSRKAWAAISGVPLVEPTPPSEEAMAYVAGVVTPLAKAMAAPVEPPKPAYNPPEVLAQRRPQYGLHVPSNDVKPVPEDELGEFAPNPEPVEGAAP